MPIQRVGAMPVQDPQQLANDPGPGEPCRSRSRAYIHYPFRRFPDPASNPNIPEKTFSGKFLNLHHGKSGREAVQTTPAKHHFRESWSRWSIHGPKFAAQSPNRPASKISRV